MAPAESVTRLAELDQHDSTNAKGSGMARRIGDFIIGGVLDNRQAFRVCGWLALAEHRGLRLELMGDLGGDLAGRYVEFDVPDRTPAPDDEVEACLRELAFGQIGAAGDMRLRIARVPTCPVEELLARVKAGELPPIDEQPCLYLEWFSQNGRMVVEIPGVILRDCVEEGESEGEITPDPLPDHEHTSGPGITGLALDEFGQPYTLDFETHESDEDDPFELFPTDLEEHLRETSDAHQFEEAAIEEPPQPRDWADVIPGIDPETKAMYEQWDEIYGGQKDEMLSTLLDPALQLPHPDMVTDEATARSYVLQIAASLARVSVAFDICRHFTLVQTYRWLVEVVLSEGHVHPNQLAHEIVTHYSSWEFCPQCDAEADAEYRRTAE